MSHTARVLAAVSRQPPPGSAAEAFEQCRKRVHWLPETFSGFASDGAEVRDYAGAVLYRRQLFEKIRNEIPDAEDRTSLLSTAVNEVDHFMSVRGPDFQAAADYFRGKKRSRNKWGELCVRDEALGKVVEANPYAIHAETMFAYVRHTRAMLCDELRAEMKSAPDRPTQFRMAQEAFNVLGQTFVSDVMGGPQNLQPLVQPAMERSRDGKAIAYGHLFRAGAAPEKLHP